MCQRADGDNVIGIAHSSNKMIIPKTANPTSLEFCKYIICVNSEQYYFYFSTRHQEVQTKHKDTKK